ncbi:RNA polymerase I-specific transcription initiation factor RRN3 [Anthonomus grandis grandis]|uniref:RNA polymerase I-specific transcription initiation factor RRN3 n=1 Tax=Anthonomus grandis grandis TaxID=2921223 RepID=UPI002166802C|nr:RNA polymerase I-specific transcription initiation factor RRN3 [Anthonomus grandis grandis]
MYCKDKTLLKTSSKARSSVGGSSILKKTSSIRRRLTEIVQTPTKVRFQLPHSRRVRNILEAYVSSKETKEYLSLVCLIRDAQLLDSDLSSLINEATECISLLNQDLRLFVEALLSVNWVDRSSDVVKEYQSFIVNLLSAHNYHAKYVIDKLVGLFLPNPKDPVWPDGKITSTDLPKCLNVHVVIKILLDVIPMCKDLLLQSLSKQYPYYNKPTHIQEYYLYNLLMLLSYQPHLRPDILHLVFSKLIIMDVNAPKEDILKPLEEDEDIFQMDDCDSKSVKTVHTGFTEVNRASLGVALDVCMNKIFEFIVKECNGENGELSWENIKSIYHDLLSVFDKVILPTYSSLHVQFVMFLLCSLKPAVTEAFLNYLWKKVCNPNLAIVLRQAAVTYIASLVARGMFVSLPVVKETMRQMAEWIHSYIGSQDSLDSVNSDVRVHTVFYSVCQALFYLVSFRHKDLVDRKKNIIFLESLQLGKIVTNRLNPLRVCQPAVVQNFAAVTRKYQLAYCYTIIDHNARNCMPTIHQDEKGSQMISDHILSDFYPFDPYVLERSGEKIQPCYRDYQEKPYSNAMEVDQRQNEIDDFLENVEASPSTSHKNVYNFSYSTSPGFKFKM